MLSRRLFLQGVRRASRSLEPALAPTRAESNPGFVSTSPTYRITPPGWPPGLELQMRRSSPTSTPANPGCPPIAFVEIVAVTNAMAPDIVVLLGDFNAGHRYVTGAVHAPQWGEVLEGLRAPLGAHAILGNHDWWHGALPGMKADGAESVRRALRHAHITVLENQSIPIDHHGRRFWLAGLADQMAFRTGKHGHHGLDDLDGTLAQIDDDAPILLLAHEPFVFSRVPERVSLTLCGHTHGGQVNVPILSPWYERTRMGTEHVYGHIVENGRHMIISGGLGTSIAPIRFMRPPEIVMVTLGGPRRAGDRLRRHPG